MGKKQRTADHRGVVNDRAIDSDFTYSSPDHKKAATQPQVK
jgi:hypothetical protein